jgi:glycosyltransferase 2 family protein
MGIFKKIVSIVLRIAASMLMLAFLFKQVDVQAILKVIKSADIGLLLVACAVFFLTYVFCLFRWEMLLRAADIKLPLKRVIFSFAGGTFFNLFLPSTIGGDLIRSLDLSAHTKKPKEIVATVLMDRLSGYIGLVVVALLAVFLGWRFLDDKSVLVTVFVVAGILVAILLAFFNTFLYTKINGLLTTLRLGKAGELIRNLHQEIHRFRGHKKVIVKNVLLSVLIQTISPIITYIIAVSLGIQVNIIYFFIFLPVIGAITLLPISLGGLGLRDATTIFFFAKIGVSKDLAFAMSLLSFTFLLMYGSIAGLIYFVTVNHRKLPQQP